MDNGAILYRRFLEGNESAFDEIMNLYFDNLIFFLDCIIHDIAQAEDISIDVFALLASKTSNYNFKVSLKTYIFMLGRSRALNYIKHNKKLHMTVLEDLEQEISDRELLEETVIRDELKRTVNAAISTLPDDMREAVYLVYFEQLSYDETARIMKKNRKQIDNLLYRAKKMLRTVLKEGEQLL